MVVAYHIPPIDAWGTTWPEYLALIIHAQESEEDGDDDSPAPSRTVDSADAATDFFEKLASSKAPLRVTSGN